MTKFWVRLLQVAPALLVTGFLLTACSTVGGEGGDYYEEYQTMEVRLTDGRILECIFFGSHAGYDCDWGNIQ